MTKQRWCNIVPVKEQVASVYIEGIVILLERLEPGTSHVKVFLYVVKRAEATLDLKKAVCY